MKKCSQTKRLQLTICLCLGVLAFSSYVNAEQICFQLETEFDDESVWGDSAFSTENTYFRRARGLLISIDGEYRNLDYITGCTDLPSGSYPVVLHAEGTVRHINVKSYAEVDSVTVYIPTITMFRDEMSATTLVPLDFGYSYAAEDIHERRAWHNLSVGLFAMFRHRLNLGDHGSRCEYDGWYDPNDPEKDRHGSINDKTIVFHSVGGGSSLWQNCPLTDFSVTGKSNVDIPAVGVGKSGRTNYRSTVAHELGHVLMMMRMGHRTKTDDSASLCGCQGSMAAENTPYGASAHELLSREFSSSAAREGWAEFYAAWLFNRVSQYDCTKKDEAHLDFDLDGQIDTTYSQSGYDKVFDCEGNDIPSFLTPLNDYPSGDNWVTARNWLQDAYDAGACGDTSIYTDADCAMGTTAHGTAYDWMRFFWDMATDEGINIGTLANLYVDMCPASWDESPAGITYWMPEIQLYYSALEHDVFDEYVNQLSNGVFWY